VRVASCLRCALASTCPIPRRLTLLSSQFLPLLRQVMTMDWHSHTKHRWSRKHMAVAHAKVRGGASEAMASVCSCYKEMDPCVS